jgi:hypothetical protein
MTLIWLKWRSRCEWELVSLKRLGGLGRTRCGGVMASKTLFEQYCSPFDKILIG